MPVSTSSMIQNPYGRGNVLAPGVVFQRIEQGERLNTITDDKERMQISALYNLSNSERYTRQQIARYFGQQSSYDINRIIKVPWKVLELLAQNFIPDWKREMLIGLVFHYMDHTEAHTPPCPFCFIDTERINYAVNPVNDDYIRIVHAHMQHEVDPDKYNALAELDIPEIIPVFGGKAIKQKTKEIPPPENHEEAPVHEEENVKEKGLPADCLTLVVPPHNHANGFSPAPEQELSVLVDLCIRQVLGEHLISMEQRLVEVVSRTIHNTYKEDVTCIAQQKEYIADLNKQLEEREFKITELEKTLGDIGEKAKEINEYYSVLHRDSADITSAILRVTQKALTVEANPEQALAFEE